MVFLEPVTNIRVQAVILLKQSKTVFDSSSDVATMDLN